MEDKRYTSKKKQFNFKLLGFILAAFLILSYFYAMLFGDRSIFIYLKDKNRLEILKKEYNSLQNQNQKLQKKYFELIQLTPDEDAF